MFKRLAITLRIDINDKEIFEKLLIKHQIPINPKAITPRVNDPYYTKKNIIVCNYYSFASELTDYEKITLATRLQEHVAINKYLNKYLDKYKNLKYLKEYLLDSSHLLLIFEGIINHDDIVEFTSETIFNLANIGLGISYNHVYEA